MLDCYEDLKILERNNLSYSFNTHSFEFLNRISVKNRIILSIFITSLLGFIIAYPVTYNYFVTKDQLVAKHRFKCEFLNLTVFLKILHWQLIFVAKD